MGESNHAITRRPAEVPATRHDAILSHTHHSHLPASRTESGLLISFGALPNLK